MPATHSPIGVPSESFFGAVTSIQIYHNILWSKYKGRVFSELYRMCAEEAIDIAFVQIAETESDRVALGGVDTSYHQYPYQLLFKGAYFDVPFVRRAAELAGQAWRTKADLVVLAGYERPEYWVMLAVLVLRGKRRAVFCDSTQYDRTRKWAKTVAKRSFFALCHGFFAYGQRSKEYLQSLGVPPAKVYFRCQAAALPSGYDAEDALAKRLAVIQAGGCRDRFVYVGRLSPEKDLGSLLQAFSTVVALRPGARLHFCGAGPELGALQQQTAALGLTGHVQFEGPQGLSRLVEQYRLAAAMVLPSWSEPWGLVVNEALSYGCPVIVSHRCGCVPELVHDGQTGYVFEAGNAAALAEKMLLLAATDIAESERFARNALALIRKYSPADAANQILVGAQSILASAQ